MKSLQVCITKLKHNRKSEQRRFFKSPNSRLLWGGLPSKTTLMSECCSNQGSSSLIVLLSSLKKTLIKFHFLRDFNFTSFYVCCKVQQDLISTFKCWLSRLDCGNDRTLPTIALLFCDWSVCGLIPVSLGSMRMERIPSGIVFWMVSSWSDSW